MIRGLADKLRLRWLRRDEHESLALRRLFAERWRVEVGMYSYGCFDPWRISGPIRIGRYCSFAKTARVLDANHPIEAMSTHPYFYEKRFGIVAEDRIVSDLLIVEDDVWVSHNATIAPGCKFIGRGAIIGAGAVVTRDVPAYTIVAGMPAKPLRMRFDPDTIAWLEASRWWEQDAATLGRRAAADPQSVYAPALARQRAS